MCIYNNNNNIIIITYDTLNTLKVMRKMVVSFTNRPRC